MNLKHLPKDQYFYRPLLLQSANKSMIPEHYSWRELTPGCMVPVVDQGECGSCYAHATTTMLAERLCVQAHIEAGHKQSSAVVEPLSPNQVMSCDPYAQGCNGGTIAQVLAYMEEQAVPTVKCYGKYEPLDKECSQRCSDKKEMGVKCVSNSKV